MCCTVSHPMPFYLILCKNTGKCYFPLAEVRKKRKMFSHTLQILLFPMRIILSRIPIELFNYLQHNRFSFISFYFSFDSNINSYFLLSFCLLYSSFLYYPWHFLNFIFYSQFLLWKRPWKKVRFLLYILYYLYCSIKWLLQVYILHAKIILICV